MYYLVSIIRNFLFNKGLIKSISHQDVFVLCVGNIRVGGTGKTPMVEYLVRNLKEDFPLAVVSLGYKRKTKGLREITQKDTFLTVGDEPKQMSEKFKDVKFFVNKDRNEAINYIKKTYPEIKLIILDDAYQYRKTRPTKTILLTEYARPFYKDRIIPYGRLRERIKEKQRADYIVVTKSPQNISLEEKLSIQQEINKNDKQEIFFSHIEYSNDNQEILKGKDVVLLAGIDNPKPLKDYLESFCDVKTLIKYPDHHNFSSQDIENVKKISQEFSAQIVTTEKDYMRLKEENLDLVVQNIEVTVEDNFINRLKDEIRRYTRS